MASTNESPARGSIRRAAKAAYFGAAAIPDHAPRRDGTAFTITRDAVVAEARRWIGTPYAHRAASRGAGCDCLGLIRGVRRAFLGPEPEATPTYAPGWSVAAMRRGRDPLMEAATRWLVPIPADQAERGDVLLFRWRVGLPARHAALIASERKP